MHDKFDLFFYDSHLLKYVGGKIGGSSVQRRLESNPHDLWSLASRCLGAKRKCKKNAMNAGFFYETDEGLRIASCLPLITIGKCWEQSWPSFSAGEARHGAIAQRAPPHWECG